MRPMSEVVSDLLERRANDRAELKKQIDGAGGVRSFLREHYAPLDRIVPPRATEQELGGHALWEFDHAKARLEECARCPQDGGACDGASGLYAEGLEPVWGEHGLTPRRCARWARYEERRRLARAGVGRSMLGVSFDGIAPRSASQRRAIETCREFVDNDPVANGFSLVLQGPTGAGKTHLAVAVLRELLRRRRSGLFAYVPLMLDEVKRQWLEFESSELFERAISSDVLVLDDLGAERPTPFKSEKLEILVSTRAFHARSLVITQNAPLEILEETIGAPVARRIAQLPGAWVELEA